MENSAFKEQWHLAVSKRTPKKKNYDELCTYQILLKLAFKDPTTFISSCILECVKCQNFFFKLKISFAVEV